jgi:hypothetical protein
MKLIGTFCDYVNKPKNAKLIFFNTGRCCLQKTVRYIVGQEVKEILRDLRLTWSVLSNVTPCSLVDNINVLERTFYPEVRSSWFLQYVRHHVPDDSNLVI